MDVEVAKITEIIANDIYGKLSNDGIRLFAPRLDELGNWIMDLQMAIDNNIEYEIFIFNTEYYQLLDKVNNIKEF